MGRCALSVLLKEVGVKKEGSWLVDEGSDGSKYTYCIPLTKAMDGSAQHAMGRLGKVAWPTVW